MATEIFTGNNLRMILDTETDANSPITETLKDAVRYAIENLLIIGYSTGVTGTVVSCSTATLTDTANFTGNDVHNGHTLVMTSGSAKGNSYTIDDTTVNTLVCTGDDLEADGVAAGGGDTYEVFYDLLVNVDGHDHDGVNSAEVVLANAQVTQVKLKTDMTSVNSAAKANVELPGGEYGFYPQINISTTDAVQVYICDGARLAASYTTTICLVPNSNTVYAQQRYVTSSGEVHWIFLLKDKATGETISMLETPDHPCFGNGNRPLLVPHPFCDYDPKIHEIIVVNPSREQVQDAIARTVPIVGGGYLTSKALKENKYEVDGSRFERPILDVFADDFEIIENKDADWPDIPITVGLPKVLNGKIVNDYRFMVGELVTPIRVPIKKPDYITPLGMRLK